MIGLLYLLRHHPDAVEADLQIRCNGIDYRDRWRFDADGNRKLTIRRIGVLLRNLPPDSATHIALGGSGWTLDNYLVASLWTAITGAPHPALPKVEKVEDPIRLKRIEQSRARMEERKLKLASGEIPMN